MKNISIFSLFIIAFSMITNVSACSVGPDWSPEPKFHFESSDVVFVGTVTDFEHVGDINGTFVITFDVEKSYKGDIDSSVKIKTGANSALCGYDNPETFLEGDVWSIYATNSLYTSSIVANTKYDSINSAISIMNKVLEDNIEICTLEFDPVCGRKDTGIRCITTPCDSSEDISYSNICHLEADKAEFLYQGSCKINVEAPANCMRWFDGCNQCFRESEGVPLACTEMACMENKDPVCNEYFEISKEDNTKDNITKEVIVPNSPVEEPVIKDPKIEYPKHYRYIILGFGIIFFIYFIYMTLIKKNKKIKKMVPINQDVINAQKNNSTTNNFSKMSRIDYIHEEVKIFHE